MSFRVADLFCGAGGLSEGFRQAGFAVAAGSDIDPDACATYALNFPEARTVWGDIRDAGVRSAVLDAAGDCDVVAGGPPCQAFSQVRNHARVIDDPRNSLYREFVGIVREVLPRIFVMENVPGLDQMGVREQILEDLAAGGRYEVDSCVADAADFGVPQTRQRVLFTGVLSGLDLGIPRFQGTCATALFGLQRRKDESGVRYAVRTADRLPFAPLTRGSLADPDDLWAVTAEQAIGDLAVLQAGRRDDAIPYGELPSPSSAYQRLMRAGAGDILANVQVPRMNEDTAIRLRSVPEGGNYRDLPEECTARYLTGQKWGPDNGTGRLTRHHYYAYRRLHRSIWAWTLNTKADSVYHYLPCRALSVREFARLQSFPDSFVFTTDSSRSDLPGRISGGAAHSRYRQVGNAVPPLLARHLALAIRDVLENQKACERRSEAAG